MSLYRTPMPSTSATASLPPPPVVHRGRIALFLDLDGVLAPLAATPGAVQPDARRTAVLERISSRLGGRVAVVSGRPLAEIDRITGGAAGAASGVHGLERRDAGGALEHRAPAPALPDVTRALRAFAEPRPGVIVEDKRGAVALHYRQAPDQAAEATALAHALAATHGLALQPGSMVVELKTPGSDKGAAVAAFMREAPFAGATPIMVGDDLTDEDGFRAATRLGGFGVLVGPMRETAARCGLADVEAVLTWLDDLTEAPE